MTAYDPGFGTGKTFKSVKDLNVAAANGWITPEYITAMAKARPDMFQGIENPGSLLTQNFFEGESGPIQQGYALDPKLRQILSGMTMNRIGAAGMKDGRSNALIDAQGNIVYADKPYSYDPAGDTLKSVLEAGALAAAAFGGIGMLGHGPMAGLFGGASSGASAGAAGGAAGGSAIDAALAEAMMSAGTLAPEGVAALIPTGAQLGAVNGGSLLAGGMLGGGMGAASGIGSTLSSAAGKLLDFAKDNPRLAGGLVGGLLGGTSGSSGGGGYKYTGPMPTISREGWNPQAQANLMQTQSVVQGLPQVQGNQYSGLLRYLGG